jgi:hypothetical protein
MFTERCKSFPTDEAVIVEVHVSRENIVNVPKFPSFLVFCCPVGT